MTVNTNPRRCKHSVSISISSPPISPTPSTPSTYSKERRLAERAVHRASILTKRAISLTPSYWASSSSSSSSSSSPVSHSPNLNLNPPPPPRKLSNGELSKSDASPVTAADFAAQALLIAAIHGAFPHDGFVGEEDAEPLRRDPLLAGQVFDFVRQYANVKFYHAGGDDDCCEDDDDDDEEEEEELLYTPKSVEEMCEIIDLGGRGQGGRKGRFWALDPIDGTATFVKGQQYAVSLALIEDGREVVGVLGCPNLKVPSEEGTFSRPVAVQETSVDEEGVGLLLSAVKGQGAWARGMGWEGSKLRTATRIGSPPPSRRNGLLKVGNGVHVAEDDDPVKLEDLHFIDSSLSTATLSHKVREIAALCGVLPSSSSSSPSSSFTELYSSHVRYVALILGGRNAIQVRFPRHPRNNTNTTPPASSQIQKEASMCIWDHAGAQLIYTESRAGKGRVTDLCGKEIDFGTGRRLEGNWGILTCDESVHAQILDMVRGMLLESEESR